MLQALSESLVPLWDVLSSQRQTSGHEESFVAASEHFQIFQQEVLSSFAWALKLFWVVSGGISD